MNNNLTEIVFILDRSGSMSGLEEDTIGGFNSLIRKQQKETEGEAKVSVILFNHESEVLYNHVDINKVEPMQDSQYYVGGSTALLDAMGEAITRMRNSYRELDKEERPGKVLFVITTDGEENSSHKYSYRTIKKMVKEVQADYDWEFLFLGANIDAIGAASDLGIREDRAMNYHCDSVGTAVNFAALGRAVSGLRSCKKSSECARVMVDCIREVEADYNSR